MRCGGLALQDNEVPQAPGTEETTELLRPVAMVDDRPRP